MPRGEKTPAAPLPSGISSPVEMVGRRYGTRRVVRAWYVGRRLILRLFCECGDVTDVPYSHLTRRERLGRGYYSGDIGCPSCAAVAYHGTLTHAEARRRIEESEAAEHAAVLS